MADKKLLRLLRKRLDNVLYGKFPELKDGKVKKEQWFINHEHVDHYGYGLKVTIYRLPKTVCVWLTSMSNKYPKYVSCQFKVLGLTDIEFKTKTLDEYDSLMGLLRIS